MPLRWLCELGKTFIILSALPANCAINGGLIRFNCPRSTSYLEANISYLIRFCVGDRFYLCENKIVCQYDYEEHILPIQESLAGQTLGSNFSGPQFRDRDSTLSKLATNVTNYREDTNGDPGTDEAVDAGAAAEIPGRELNFSRRKAELLIMDSCRDESAKKNELPSSALVEASDELTESDDRGDCATKDARA